MIASQPLEPTQVLAKFKAVMEELCLQTSYQVVCFREPEHAPKRKGNQNGTDIVDAIAR